MYQKRKRLENTLILFLDIGSVLISSALAFWLRFEKLWGVQTHGDQLWQIIYLCLLVVFVDLFFDLNHHFFERGRGSEFLSVLRQAGLYSLFWIFLLYVLHNADQLSRLVFGYFILLNLMITYLVHLGFKEYMTQVFKYGKYSNHMLLVTTSDRVETILDQIREENEWSRILTGIILLDQTAVGGDVNGYPVVADFDTMMDYVIHNKIDEVFFACPEEYRKDSRIRSCLYDMEMMGIIVDIDIEAFDLLNRGKKTLNRVGRYAVVTFSRNIISTRGKILKRMLDIVGSLVGMVIFAVATVFVAPMIKLESSGPVFFGQTRIGKNGRRFTFYKFRSMYQDAEQRKKELMEQNEVHGLMFKMKEDPRITRVGHFIRRTSIDELPQFWNVLKGDMSLVGTRPPTVDEFERYEAKHKCRLSMTPGLTGMWQISGRSDITDFDEVVQLDMEYIDNWNLLKDIKILFKTVGVVFFGKGSR